MKSTAHLPYSTKFPRIRSPVQLMLYSTKARKLSSDQLPNLRKQRWTTQCSILVMRTLTRNRKSSTPGKLYLLRLKVRTLIRCSVAQPKTANPLTARNLLRILWIDLKTLCLERLSTWRLIKTEAALGHHNQPPLLQAPIMDKSVLVVKTKEV